MAIVPDTMILNFESFHPTTILNPKIPEKNLYFDISLTR